MGAPIDPRARHEMSFVQPRSQRRHVCAGDIQSLPISLWVMPGFASTTIKTLASVGRTANTARSFASLAIAPAEARRSA